MDTRLNRNQYRASRGDGGISLVIAGAGTGKTKTLIHKIRNVISSGKTEPENILILTFSRKAAGEIKSRLHKDIGRSADSANAATFHSFGLSLILKNGRQLMRLGGFSKIPSVLDPDTKDDVIKRLIGESLDEYMGLPVKVIHELTKYPRLDYHLRKKLNDFDIHKKIENLKNRFDLYKRDNNLIDYEDMMKFSIRMLRDNDKLRKLVVNTYRYIFVDEFQDTSSNNFEMLKLLTSGGEINLFAVGDDWQSIYAFRDSRIEYIVNMKKFFPTVKIYRLNINYRSRREIVRISTRFIKKNKYRTTKLLKSHKGPGGVVECYRAGNFDDECAIISGVLDKPLPARDQNAVLFRNNWQGRYILKFLKSRYSDHDLNGIHFMTIHASKGLEFDNVIIAGVNDDIFPDAFSDIEEERRLFYVAMTRAKEKLIIIFHVNGLSSVPIFAQELGIGINKMMTL